MGLFHKTLQDALKELNNGNVKKCRDICEEHSTLYVEQETKGFMSKLRKYTNLYVENLTELGNKNIPLTDEEVRQKLEFSIKLLNKIEKYTKEFLKFENNKME